MPAATAAAPSIVASDQSPGGRPGHAQACEPEPGAGRRARRGQRAGASAVRRHAAAAPPGAGRPGRPSRRVRVGGPRRGRSGPGRGAARRSTTSASVTPSRPAVGSSSRSSGASRRKARASATRWRSPAESPAPRSPSDGVERRPAAQRPRPPRPACVDRLPQRGVVGVRPARAGCCRAIDAGEEVWSLGHPGHAGRATRPGRGRADRCRRRGPSRAAARRSPAPPRAGSTSRSRSGPVMRDDLARLDDERDPVEGGRGHAPGRSRPGRTPPAGGAPGRARRSACPASGSRLVEHAEHLLGCAQAVGAGVEVGADLAQRQVRLRAPG